MRGFSLTDDFYDALETEAQTCGGILRWEPRAKMLAALILKRSSSTLR